MLKEKYFHCHFDSYYFSFTVTLSATVKFTTLIELLNIDPFASHMATTAGAYLQFPVLSRRKSVTPPGEDTNALQDIPANTDLYSAVNPATYR